MPTKKAFSLIEIIIFIAVLSILMTTLLQSVALNLSADKQKPRKRTMVQFSGLSY